MVSSSRSQRGFIFETEIYSLINLKRFALCHMHEDIHFHLELLNKASLGSEPVHMADLDKSFQLLNRVQVMLSSTSLTADQYLIYTLKNWLARKNIIVINGSSVVGTESFPTTSAFLFSIKEILYFREKWDEALYEKSLFTNLFRVKEIHAERGKEFHFGKL